ncbi:outer membrane protein-like protein [Pseudopedobacter saltans DSM 12145]|uniref:Outer membrane protein-like protein n=2 Tax=Pseudopedobacter saltans TaxID=151895 RepID=F0S830_PSESL|nr:outer membrane protein-like protein [Pseudopedobacter saltans DSM 12145]
MLNINNNTGMKKISHNILCSIIILLGLYSFPVFAQEKLSLEQIIAEISKENLQLKSYDQKIGSQKAKTESARSWMAPMIGAGTFMTPYPGQEIMSDNDKGAWMLSVEQSIPMIGMNKATEKYLASLSSITEAQKGMTMNELKNLAKQNYFDIIINRKKLAYLEKNIEIMKTMKKLGEIRYQYNKGNLSQIYKAEGRIFEMESMLNEIESSVDIAKINLNVLMNRNPQLNFEIDESTELQFTPVANLDSTYLNHNISEIKMMDNEIGSMKLDAEMIKKEANPEIKLKFDHMSSFSAMMPRQYSAMAMLSIPIAPWSAKKYKANLKANKLEVTAMQQEKQAMLVNMLGMIKSMERNILAMENRANTFKNKVVPAMQKNLDVLLLNYQENKEELPMVIDAWETLNKAQQDYVSQLGTLYKMIIEYEKSIEK